MSKGLKLYGETDTRLIVDRISNLPPELIGNILSFLPTKEAVATSVLSTKWKWFWTFITCLDFVECLSIRAHGKDRIELLKASFIRFVYQVLFHRKPTPLNYFGVTCSQIHSGTHFTEWVSAVLPVGFKELDLSIRLRDDSLVLPFDVFSCKKVVKLKLGGGFKLDVPSIVCLPSLEVLTLDRVGFHDDASLKRLLIGCPDLKEFESIGYLGDPRLLPLELFSRRKLKKLKLGGGFVMNQPTLISLPSLKALHLCGVKNLDNESFKRFLHGCPSLQELNMMPYDATVLHIDAPMLLNLTISFQSFDVLHSKMVLDTPSLQYLKVNGIAGFATDSLEVTELSQLVEADISDVHIGIQYQVASNLIMAISEVKTLHLCRNIVEVIAQHGCKLPKFQNMTTLKFDVSNKVGWTLLSDLLEKSPVLETLVFNGLKEYPALSNPTWHAPQKVPYCLTHHLKVIQVNYFQGDIEDDEMIRYFIENRGNLKDLTIQHSRGSGNFWDANVA